MKTKTCELTMEWNDRLGIRVTWDDECELDTPPAEVVDEEGDDE